MPPKAKRIKDIATDSYKHPTADSPSRPEVGIQTQFKKRKPAVTYHYDSSLDPQMSWDEGNAAREQGESKIAHVLKHCAQANEILSSDVRTEISQNEIEIAKQEIKKAQEAALALKNLSKPFLNWTGKAEKPQFSVPTLPLFIHERLSTKAIIETLRGHKKGIDQLNLFGDPQHSITDQILRAYEHRDKWVNRMILGDSLSVMNSLLHYEGLGGQVQMIYIDPPYGIKFGSNFQPFVRKRDVKHNEDDDMTYEPEMVQAYRDTWELGLHSYLTYMRDRLFIAHELLSESGSIFVQISDENVHHLRELMDDVFGEKNFVSIITFKKTTGLTGKLLTQVSDYLIWYAKDLGQVKYRQMFQPKELGGEGATHYNKVMLRDGKTRTITKQEIFDPSTLPAGARIYEPSPMISQGNPLFTYEYKGKQFSGTYKTTKEGIDNLAKAHRLEIMGNLLRYRRFLDDYPVYPITNIWEDILGIQSRSDPKIYVVQTSTSAIQRCILMTTDPGDLVFDPTCGSGTTAYVAEQWGRRWITCDVSRVPLALARQRLLTATFDWYELKDDSRGPAGGFVYKRKQNSKGEEVGGIVPHITLKSIANNEPPQEEVLVDRPEKISGITRVSGPFVLEATLPSPMELTDSVATASEKDDDHAVFSDRVLEVLRKVKTLQLSGNRKIEFKNIRFPAKTLSLSAEAIVEATSLPGASLPEAIDESVEKDRNLLTFSQKPVAFVFGPENGAASERLVYEAAKEAFAKDYAHLFVIGFGVEPNARLLIENCGQVVGINATYVEATRDLLMGDLLKNMRSSQVFSVCGLPEVRIKKAKCQHPDGKTTDGFQVDLLGVDVFDPITMTSESRPGVDVPAWFLDTDYNGRVFHVCQAFFPRTGAWESLKKALRADYNVDVWDHLAGTTSAPFEAGDNKQIAVKVIDDRGNELLVVKKLSETK